jgi:hypothetical protein
MLKFMYGLIDFYFHFYFKLLYSCPLVTLLETSLQTSLKLSLSIEYFFFMIHRNTWDISLVVNWETQGGRGPPTITLT